MKSDIARPDPKDIQDLAPQFLNLSQKIMVFIPLMT